MVPWLRCVRILVAVGGIVLAANLVVVFVNLDIARSAVEGIQSKQVDFRKYSLALTLVGVTIVILELVTAWLLTISPRYAVSNLRASAPSRDGWQRFLRNYCISIAAVASTTAILALIVFAVGLAGDNPVQRFQTELMKFFGA